MAEEQKQIDIAQIKKMIPHRYPFLFVDKVTDIRENSLTGIKNVTCNETFFQGHFPDYPVMPGVLQIEALAQASALLVIHKHKLENKPVYFMSIDKAKFRKPVVPGDQLRFELVPLRKGSRVWKMAGKAFVVKELVAEAELTAAVGG